MPYIEDKTPMPIIPVKWATFTAISDIKKEEAALTFTLTDGKEVPFTRDGNKTTVRLANGFKTITVF